MGEEGDEGRVSTSLYRGLTDGLYCDSLLATEVRSISVRTQISIRTQVSVRTQKSVRTQIFVRTHAHRFLLAHRFLFAHTRTDFFFHTSGVRFHFAHPLEVRFQFAHH